jgi:hypothetical protein
MTAVLMIYLQLYLFVDYRSPSLALLQSCALLISADAFILQHILRLLGIYLDCSYIAWFTYGVYGVLIMCLQLR